MSNDALRTARSRDHVLKNREHEVQDNGYFIEQDRIGPAVQLLPNMENQEIKDLCKVFGVRIVAKYPQHKTGKGFKRWKCKCNRLHRYLSVHSPMTHSGEACPLCGMYPPADTTK